MRNRFVVLMLLWYVLPVQAQQTAIYFDAEKGYREALDLYSKQKFAAAQKEFDATVANKNVSVEAHSNSEYFAAVCAIELTNKDAEERMLKFLEHYPENLHYNEGVFVLGNYYSRQRRWKKAIEWYTRTDKSGLSADQVDEYNFKLGYAYYMTNDLDKASKLFFEVKDKNSKYGPAAQYYYSHILYQNRNYETALTGFMKLRTNEAFGPVVPYYIAQIYFLQGKYDELLDYAPPLINSATTKNAMEIGRMVGEAYYKKGEYAKAIPYMSDYVKNSGGATRADAYDLGFCYYKTGDCDQAIASFEKLTNLADTMAQYAYYHMADCFLKKGNRQSARNAFQSAGRMDFDAMIKEESQFSYAKLTYELNFQSQAIDAFRGFIATYPKSHHIDEANTIIVKIYASTKNYRDAILAIEKINPLNRELKEIYQRVTYYRGVEMFMDNKPADAIVLFNTSLKNKMDEKLAALAQYWKAEAIYKLNGYDDAIAAYNEFLFNPSALSLEQYPLANYNLGYCYFKKEDYDNAQSWFRKYIKDKSATDAVRYNDAMLRLGDAFFMLKDQATAMDYYNQAIDNKARSIDYALFQKAVLLGVQNKMAEKVAVLQRIFNEFPKSVYFDDALYEAANASLVSGNGEQAMTYYQKIIRDYPNSSYVKKAMLGQGLVYYNSKNDEEATKSYKGVVEKYPNTPESKEALMQLKNISVSTNKVDEYLAYVKTIPNADVSQAAQDSLIYQSAELRYTQGNCEDAVKEFSNYITKFWNGTFIVNANYYKADCLFRNSKYEDALVGYNYVISQPKNSFTEKSLLNAGIISYRLKQYDKSWEDFERLESLAEVKDNIVAAQSGQMRCAYKLNRYDLAITSAQKIIAGGVEDKDLINEAHLTIARSAMAKGDMSMAKQEFEIVAQRTNSEMTAEANYNLAMIQYRQGNFKESMDIILSIEHQTPGYDYWIAKGFILLGDNYVAKADTFQAKETYKSIVSNYQSDPSNPEDLRNIAREKLFELMAAEENRNKLMIQKETQEGDTLELKN